ncbi:MAG: hypothetical protein KDA87_24620, partial [Planctomycetales bacterium]|nr:hypothetical protein [Planctomycetales bacterium]
IDAEKLRVCFEPNPTIADPEQNDWRPKWVQAQNDVRFHSEQLDGETDQLLVRFEYPRVPASRADANGVRPVSTFPYRVTSEGEHSVSTVANGSRSEFARQATSVGRGQVGGNRLPSSNTNAAPWQLFLAGDELDITVRVLSPGPSELVRVDVTGNASLDRIDAGAQTEPFRLNAQRFTLTNATSTGGVFTAFGQPARIRFQDMQVAGNQMEVDRNRNLIRINGAGAMDMTGTPQLGKSSSRTRAQPNNGDLANEKTHIQWRDGFVFDGRVARVEGKVTLENSKEQIRADRVNIHLKNPIDLGQTDANAKAEVDNVLAEGSVCAEHRIIEDNDLRTVAIFMCPSFQLNQQTGDFLAMGDGLVMAWRKGFQAGSALGAQGQSKEDPDRISFVQIEFGRQGTGNVNQRSVTFDQQVRLTYGPVRKFYDRIRPGLPLTDDDVILMCDQMTLMQVASNASGGMAVDARARGNTTIRGAWFKATGERASYDQSKGLFVLEGEGQTPARVEAQKRSSRTSTETVGQKILVWPATKEVELDDVRFLDLRTFSRLGAGR